MAKMSRQNTDTHAEKSSDQLLHEAQALFCRAVPAKRVISDELIAERRRESDQDE